MNAYDYTTMGREVEGLDINENIQLPHATENNGYESDRRYHFHGDQQKYHYYNIKGDLE